MVFDGQRDYNITNKDTLASPRRVGKEVFMKLGKNKDKDTSVSIRNVYKLEGRVPISRAIPFGLQHVLAMFVANVTPLIIIASVAVYDGQPFSAVETARLIQNCMLKVRDCLSLWACRSPSWQQACPPHPRITE